MRQHIDFPMEVSVIKFQAWPIWLKPRLTIKTHFWLVIHISGCQMSRLPFRPVGYGWQWISEGLNYVGSAVTQW